MEGSGKGLSAFGEEAVGLQGLVMAASVMRGSGLVLAGQNVSQKCKGVCVPVCLCSMCLSVCVRLYVSGLAGMCLCKCVSVSVLVCVHV